MYDQTTQYRLYPLPHADNVLAFDNPRLRAALAQIDGEMQTALDGAAVAQALKADTVVAAAANKILRLNSAGKLPADITGNAATATNVTWSGVTDAPTFVLASETVDTAAANKILRLNGAGQLPADVTGNAATATSVAWSGITGAPSFILSSDAVAAAAANKILRLDVDGKLPASITGNAATATSVAWSGVTGAPAFALQAHTHTLAIGDGSVKKLDWLSSGQLNFKAGANVALSFDATSNSVIIATSGQIAGNVDTASRLQSSRTIALGGALTGQVDFDGTANVTINAAFAAAMQPLLTGAATSIASSNLTASRVLVSDSSGKVAGSGILATELAYLSGITSGVQAQLNSKQATLGFTPVQQGGGTGQATNKIYLGWAADSSGLKAMVDSTDLGYVYTSAVGRRVPFSEIQNKPTTLAGYGITDAPKLDGTGATGTWAINISGDAYRSKTSLLSFVYDNDRTMAAVRPNSNATSVRWDFANADAAGVGGNFGSIMTLTPFDGKTASNGGPSYQLAIGSIYADTQGMPMLNVRAGLDTTWAKWWALVLAGGNGLQGQDLNDHVRAGIHRVESSLGNRPTGAGDYGNLLVMRAPGFDTITQIYGDQAGGGLYVRGGNPASTGGSGSWKAWREVLDALNFNKYAPKLDGTGATGTWPIAISGAAAAAPWSGISNKPTTLAGYGISDAPKLDGTGATGTWGISISGAAPWGNITGKPVDLVALAGLTTTGFIARTGTGTATVRSLEVSAGLSITNPAGIAGNPSIALTNTGVTASSYGSATAVAAITVDAQGRLTAAQSVTIKPDWSNVQNKPTTLQAAGLTGGTFTSAVTLAGDATSALQPVTKRQLDAASAPLAQLHALALCFK